MDERVTKAGAASAPAASPLEGIVATWSPELQAILDVVPALIWFKDRDNRILRANRLASESMGMSPGALEGCSTYDLYPAEAAKYHQDDLEVIHSGVAKLGIVETIHTGAGEQRWVRTDKIPYRNKDGEIIGVIVFSVDISERIRAEEALQRAGNELEYRVHERTAQLAEAVAQLRAEIVERERAEERVRQQQAELAHLLRLRTVEGVAAQLAHEINQPLAAIVNFASGLARRLDGGSGDIAGAQRAIDQISQQAMRAADVLQRLRDFVRKDPPRRELADVNRLVQDAALLVEPDIRRQGVSVSFELAADLPLIEVDPIQIQQVVLNLLHNALEALEGTPEPDVAVRTAIRDDGMIEVQVRDNGHGIAAPEKQIFEPFFTTKAGGLGMGLSISHSIVEAHGGELRALADQPQGAAFVFTLAPRADEALMAFLRRSPAPA